MLVLFIVKLFAILGQFLFQKMCTATVFEPKKTKPVVWHHFSSLLMTTCSLLSKICGTIPKVYIVKSSTYRVDFTFSDRVLTMSLIATMKQVQGSTLPWGVPFCTPTGSDKTLHTLTYIDRFVMKFLMNIGRCPLSPKSYKFFNVLYLQAISYALVRSKNTIVCKCLDIKTHRSFWS